jgi:hypothetical protein
VFSVCVQTEVVLHEENLAGWIGQRAETVHAADVSYLSGAPLTNGKGGVLLGLGRDEP